MKTITVTSFLVLFALCSFSQNVCPSYFNTSSTNSKCGPLGEIKMVYSNGCPGVLPEIDSVYSFGKKCDVTFASPDNSQCNSAYPALRYCLTSGKIPSGKMYEVFFRNPDNTTFKCFVPCGCAVLPVKFMSFTATVAVNTVECNWTTAYEVDNSFFVLERSLDGRNFSGVATISASSTGKYKSTDNISGLAGKNVVYYRVKQVDIDGTFSYSNILSVKLADNKNEVLITPNPFRETITVSFTAAAAGIAEIKIINLAGQVTASSKVSAAKGYNSTLINGLEKHAKGIYVIQVLVNGTLVQNQKLVKQ